jgi:hypothetical protein
MACAPCVSSGVNLQVVNGTNSTESVNGVAT